MSARDRTGVQRRHKWIEITQDLRTNVVGLVSSLSTLPDICGLLERAKLSHFKDSVTAWCSTMGLATMDELVEHSQQVANTVEMKPLEHKRFVAELGKVV